MQEGLESVQKTITITDFVCFKNKFTFYDKSGRLDNSKCVRLECLKHGTSDNSRTVGWFSFRRNTTSGMSLREKFVHHGLRDLFSPVVDTFLHLLLVETTSIQLVLEQLSMSVSKQTNKQTNNYTTLSLGLYLRVYTIRPTHSNTSLYEDS